MPCYDPLRALVVEGPQGRRLSFDKKDRGTAISLPCGICIGCRLERARQWAVRIMHESKMHEDSAFITLTFDKEHLPADGSLSVRTVQLFFKRLRRLIDPTRIRFFACGEYGETYGRPHYHAIIFGFGFPDKVPVAAPGEFTLYESKLLSAAWGFGNARIGDVSFDTACYVANYATKKLGGNRAEEAKRLCGRKPEFLVMSRRPGIGATWIDRFSGDVYPSDEVLIKGMSARPPRYYDKRALVLCWQRTADILARRQAAAEKLEEFVLKSGARLEVAPARNARRLLVRKTVAEAKAQLKLRRLERA